MKRMGQIMYLHKDSYAEYQKRHNNLFPEMRKALKEAGAHNYSIFLNKEDGMLFAYLEVDNVEKYNDIAKTDAAKKWWAYMEPLMDTNPDKSPVTVDLDEMFHLD
jgi:L-rhamnose 1-epimerase